MKMWAGVVLCVWVCDSGECPFPLSSRLLWDWWQTRRPLLWHRGHDRRAVRDTTIKWFLWTRCRSCSIMWTDFEMTSSVAVCATPYPLNTASGMNSAWPFDIIPPVPNQLFVFFLYFYVPFFSFWLMMTPVYCNSLVNIDCSTFLWVALWLSCKHSRLYFYRK